MVQKSGKLTSWYGKYLNIPLFTRCYTSPEPSTVSQMCCFYIFRTSQPNLPWNSWFPRISSRFVARMSHKTSGKIRLRKVRYDSGPLPRSSGSFLGFIRRCDWPTVDGWNPANQLRLVVYPIIYRVSYIPGGAGFQPSTVLFILLIQVLPSDLFEGFKWPLDGWKRDLHLRNQVGSLGRSWILILFLGGWLTL